MGTGLALLPLTCPPVSVSYIPCSGKQPHRNLGSEHSGNPRVDTAKGSGHWSPQGNIFPVSNVIPWAGHGGQVQGSFPRVFHCEDLHKTHHTDLMSSPQRWLKGAVFLDLGKNTFYLPGSRLPISLDPTLNSEQGKQPCDVSQRENPNNLKSHLFSLLEHFLKSCFLAFFFKVQTHDCDFLGKWERSFISDQPECREAGSLGPECTFFPLRVEVEETPRGRRFGQREC